MTDQRVWIYNWQEDRFFACLEQVTVASAGGTTTGTNNGSSDEQNVHKVCPAPLYSGRQVELNNFVGVAVGTVQNIGALKYNIPRPVTVTILSQEHQLSSPLVYTPTKLLGAPHSLPKWRCALIHLSGDYDTGVKTSANLKGGVNTPADDSQQESRQRQQKLAHVRRFILNNEFRLGVHLTAYDTFELNACLLYTVRFPTARTKLPYGWVTIRSVTNVTDQGNDFYDVIQDTTEKHSYGESSGCESTCVGPDDTCERLNTAELPLLSCVSIDIEVAVSSKAGVFPHYSVNPILCVACIDGVLDPNSDDFLVSRRIIYTTLSCTCKDLDTCIDYGECLLKKVTYKIYSSHTRDDKTTTTTPFKQPEVPVTLRRYTDEREMLYDCIRESIIPNLVVTGYNIARFDMPYIFCRYLVLRSMAPLVSKGVVNSGNRKPSHKKYKPVATAWEPPELTREQYQMLDETYGNTFFRHQLPLYRWQKIAATIRLPYQLIVDVYSYVHQFSEAAFKNLVTKKLDDVCIFENISGGKYGLPKVPQVVPTTQPFNKSSSSPPVQPPHVTSKRLPMPSLSTLDIVRSLDPHLILPYCDRDTALPLVLLTDKKYFRFIVSLSILTGFSAEAVLETNISAIISTFHNLYSVVVAKSITPYRFVYNGTSAVGTDYTFHLRHVLPDRVFYGGSNSTLGEGVDTKNTAKEPTGGQKTAKHNLPAGVATTLKRKRYEYYNRKDDNSSDNSDGNGGDNDDADRDDSNEDFEDVMKGGHVIEPIAGIYEGAVDSIDIESLYPSTEIALNMSPGTIFRLSHREFEGLGGYARFKKRFNIYLADRVGFYLLTLRGPKGPFAQVQHHLLQLRRETKRSSSLLLKRNDPNRWFQLDAIQRVLKLMANGSYGTVSSKMFLATTNRSIGELTTQVARGILTAVEKEFSAVYGIPVIYGDTDSVMLHASTVNCSQMLRHMKAAAADRQSATQLSAANCEGQASPTELVKRLSVTSMVRDTFATEVPSGDSLAWLATCVVGKYFPDTVDLTTGEPVVRFVFERRYALYAVCKKKMNAALLSPCRELRVTGLKSHAPAAVRAAVLRIYKKILEYRVEKNATLTGGTVRLFQPPSQSDLRWVARQYLNEYRSHFVHNFANSRTVNKVKSTLSRPPDYIRRITLVKGSKVTTDTVEHVRIWSDFNITRLDQVLNLRTSDEFISRYIVDIRPLFFEMDRKSLLRDTLVSTSSAQQAPQVPSLSSSSNKDNIEAATDRAATVTSITTTMWLTKVVEPSLQPQNSSSDKTPQLFPFTCRVFNLTDNVTKLPCEKILRVKFSSDCKGPQPLLQYLFRLQGIAAALLPPSCRTEVTDWGPKVGLQLMLQDALTQMMIRSKRRATAVGVAPPTLKTPHDNTSTIKPVIDSDQNRGTSSDRLAPKGRRGSIPKSCPLIPLPNLELTNPLETLLRHRNYQGWEIGPHESDLISFLCLLTVFYYDPKAPVAKRPRQPVGGYDKNRETLPLKGLQVSQTSGLPTFSQNLNSTLRDLIAHTSSAQNTTIIRSSFGCVKLIGDKIVQMTASVHDM